MLDTRYDDLYLVILHPTLPHVWLIDDVKGWTLPKVIVPISPNDHRWRDSPRINQAARQQLGMSIITLECLSITPFPDGAEHGTGVFVVENRSLEWISSSHGQWMGRKSLADVDLTHPEHRPLLDAWFASAEADAKLGLPWMQEGWFDEASTWIDSQLQVHGLGTIGAIEQVRSWWPSCILRVPTTGGDLYFKATPPMFGYEPSLMTVIAAQYPTLVPQVMAIDTERRWLLMEGVPGVRLNQYPNTARHLPVWEQLLELFTQLQLRYAGHCEELLELGCPDWRLNRLANAVDPFFALLPSLLQGVDDQPSPTEWDQLYAAAPLLKTMCRELDRLDIPASLHHGDFHSPNILVTDTQCRLIDWAGFVGVTHPFLSLWIVLDAQENEEAREYLSTKYIERWHTYGTSDDLKTALKLALPLAAWCGALGHHTQFVQAVTGVPWDARGEQENILWSLRRMLALM